MNAIPEPPPVIVIEVMPSDPTEGCSDRDIGLAIERACEKRRLTQIEFAKRIVYTENGQEKHISQAQVSRLLNARQGWRSSTLRAFAKALNAEIIVRYR